MLRGIRMPSSAQPPSVNRADGGELRYRVAHRVKRWKSGEAPPVEAAGRLPAGHSRDYCVTSKPNRNKLPSEHLETTIRKGDSK